MNSKHFMNLSSCFSQQWEHTRMQDNVKSSNFTLGCLLTGPHPGSCFHQFLHALITICAYMSMHMCICRHLNVTVFIHIGIVQ